MTIVPTTLSRMPIGRTPLLRQMTFACTLLPGLFAVALADEVQPVAKRVPVMQVLPLPYDQASFQQEGRELTRYHFGPTLERPFWYPLIGPGGRSLTRMGHPRDPHSHSHHNSVWISHHNVDGISFWADRGRGQIVHRLVKTYEDGDDRQDGAATMLCRAAWLADGKRVVMNEWRRTTVQPLGDGDWLMLIDLSFETPGNEPVVLGETPFGPIGVRMAKTIGVHDGGGRILNSSGQVNEKAVFRQPARWVDYSGRVTNTTTGGIALLDHPGNPSHPTPFHVRGDGWMGVCLTLNGPITIEPDKPLQLSYGLWIHAGVPKVEDVERRWKAFSQRERAALPPK